MYRVIYEQGNGYKCSCCRQTWTEYEDFETKDEIIKFLSRLEAIRINPKMAKYQDENDIDVTNIFQIDNSLDNMTFDNDIVNNMLNNYEKEKKSKERKKKINKILKG